MSIILISIILVGILVTIIIFIYNGLVKARNQVRNAWAQIDVQLKRRTDLIPNLIETVKGYASHEKNVLENVTKARSALMSASNPKEAADADNMLTGALKSLFAVSENYPDLKASQNFLQMQEELVGTENKVAATRQFYNDLVMTYNTKIESIPTNIIAKLFNFNEEELFEISPEEREVPKVSFT